MKNRPTFLPTPSAYTRAPCGGQSSIDAACALERPAKSRFPTTAISCVSFVAFLLVVADVFYFARVL